MSCPQCNGYGFKVTVVPVWEDYAPHGGFWAEDTREELCPCPAGAAAEAQLKEMAEKAATLSAR